MREQEKKLFENLLRDIGENYRSKEKLTGSFTMRGTLSRNELMVVGRSLNGWSIGMHAHDFKDVNRRQFLAKRTFKNPTTMINVLCTG